MVIRRAVSLDRHIESHSPRGSKVISRTMPGVCVADTWAQKIIANQKVKERSAKAL